MRPRSFNDFNFDNSSLMRSCLLLLLPLLDDDDEECDGALMTGETVAVVLVVVVVVVGLLLLLVFCVAAAVACLGGGGNLTFVVLGVVGVVGADAGDWLVLRSHWETLLAIFDDILVLFLVFSCECCFVVSCWNWRVKWKAVKALQASKHFSSQKLRKRRFTADRSALFTKGAMK